MEEAIDFQRARYYLNQATAMADKNRAFPWYSIYDLRHDLILPTGVSIDLQVFSQHGPCMAPAFRDVISYLIIHRPIH